MKPMIDQAFWSDPDIETSKAGVKLAALWLITNSQTSLLGICGASASRFEFETGLKADALESALRSLPRAFKRFGNIIFVRNYVRHQFGSGEKLTRNNCFAALRSLFLSVKNEDLRDFILTEYPEFKGVSDKGSKALPSPSKGFQALPDAESGAVSESKPDQPKAPRKRPETDTDEEWLNGLAKKDCYRPVDIRAELEKAQTWTSANHRECNRRFFLNWLNRALEDARGRAPLSAAKAQKQEDPAGWREFLASISRPYEQFRFAPGFLKTDFGKSKFSKP